MRCGVSIYLRQGPSYSRGGQEYRRDFMVRSWHAGELGQDGMALRVRHGVDLAVTSTPMNKPCEGGNWRILLAADLDSRPGVRSTKRKLVSCLLVRSKLAHYALGREMCCRPIRSLEQASDASVWGAKRMTRYREIDHSDGVRQHNV